MLCRHIPDRDHTLCRHVPDKDHTHCADTYLTGVVAQAHVVSLHIRQVPILAAQIAEVLEVGPQLFGAMSPHVARGPGESCADLHPQKRSLSDNLFSVCFHYYDYVSECAADS